MRGVINIKLNDASRPCHTLKGFSGSRPLTDRERALIVLLGGYNVCGRGIPLEKVEALLARFDALVFEMEEMITDQGRKLKETQ